MIENLNWRRGEIPPQDSESDSCTFVELSFHTGDWDQPRLSRGLPSGAETLQEGERDPKRTKLETGAWKDARAITLWIDNTLLVPEDTLSTVQGTAAVQKWVDAMKVIGKNSPNVEMFSILVHPKSGMCFPVKALSAFLSETTKLKLLHISTALRGQRMDLVHLQNILHSHCVNLEELNSFGATIPCARSLQEKESEVAGSLVVVPTNLKRLCIRGHIFTDANASMLSNLLSCSGLVYLQLDITLESSVLKMISQLVTKGCPELFVFGIGVAPRNPKLPPTAEELGALEELAGDVANSKILSLNLRLHKSLANSDKIGEIMKKMLRHNYWCRYFTLEVFDNDESISEEYYTEAEAIQDLSIAIQWKSEVETFVRLNRTRRSCLLTYYPPGAVARKQPWTELLEGLGCPPGCRGERVGQRASWRQLIERAKERNEEEEDENPLIDEEVLTGLYLFLRGHVSDLCSSARSSKGYGTRATHLLPTHLLPIKMEWLKKVKKAYDSLVAFMASRARFLVHSVHEEVCRTSAETSYAVLRQYNAALVDDDEPIASEASQFVIENCVRRCDILKQWAEMDAYAQSNRETIVEYSRDWYSAEIHTRRGILPYSSTQVFDS